MGILSGTVVKFRSHAIFLQTQLVQSKKKKKHFFKSNRTVGNLRSPTLGVPSVQIALGSPLIKKLFAVKISLKEIKIEIYTFMRSDSTHWIFQGLLNSCLLRYKTHWWFFPFFFFFLSYRSPSLGSHSISDEERREREERYYGHDENNRSTSVDHEVPEIYIPQPEFLTRMPTSELR